jgi:hypothetical protein
MTAVLVAIVGTIIALAMMILDPRGQHGRLLTRTEASSHAIEPVAPA